MTPEKYRDRLFSAAVHFVERNRPNHAEPLVGDRDFLADVDQILDELHEHLVNHTRSRTSDTKGNQ